MNLPKWLQSSDGSKKLSARANSFLVGLLPALIFLLPLFGVDLSLEAGQGGVELVVKIIVALEGLLALVWQVKGWIDRSFRKRMGLGVFK